MYILLAQMISYKFLRCHFYFVQPDTITVLLRATVKPVTFLHAPFRPYLTISARKVKPLSGQAQHPLSDDIAVDLRGALRYGRAPRAEHGVNPSTIINCVLRIPHHLRVSPYDLHHHVPPPLPHLGPVVLRYGNFESGELALPPPGNH